MRQAADPVVFAAGLRRLQAEVAAAERQWRFALAEYRRAAQGLRAEIRWRPEAR